MFLAISPFESEIILRFFFELRVVVNHLLPLFLWSIGVILGHKLYLVNFEAVRLKTFNFFKNLHISLRIWLRILSESLGSHQLVIVDDFSVDKTYEVLLDKVDNLLIFIF